MRKVRYLGNLGPAKNEHGYWEAGDVKELNEHAAALLVASGLFEYVADEPAPKKKRAVAADEPALD